MGKQNELRRVLTPYCYHHYPFIQGEGQHGTLSVAEPICSTKQVSSMPAQELFKYSRGKGGHRCRDHPGNTEVSHESSGENTQGQGEFLS